MSINITLCKNLNKIFKLPVHPFNLNNSGISTYSEWQYEKGKETLKFYLEHSSETEMFKDKVVLDIGCGAGGKTVYYASEGVKSIYGLEILEKYKDEAEALAIKMGYFDKFNYINEDASKMSFDDETFDTIIMNDAMEHVDNPQQVLNECMRVLKKGGRLYLNFPPYNHPFGAHLSDAIAIPWVHCFFDDKTLIEVYKNEVKNLIDGDNRIEFRISKKDNNEEYFSYINKMTIKRFNRILKNGNFNIIYYNEKPLRRILYQLAKLPILKEYFVKMVVCIIQKEN